MSKQSISDLRKKIFDLSLAETERDRAAQSMRIQAYSKALENAYLSGLNCSPAIRLTGMNDKAYEAYKKQWVPFLKLEDLEDQSNTFRCMVGDRFLTDNRVPYGWAAQRFELAIWYHDNLVCLSDTYHNSRRELRNHMAVGLIVSAPNKEPQLRGKLGLLVHCAALMWAEALGMDEVHYLGDFSPEGEIMLRRLVNQYNFQAEKRGCPDSGDTQRFSVYKNLRIFGSKTPQPTPL